MEHFLLIIVSMCIFKFTIVVYCNRFQIDLAPITKNTNTSEPCLALKLMDWNTKFGSQVKFFSTLCRCFFILPEGEWFRF